GRITDLIRGFAGWSDAVLTASILLAVGSTVVAAAALVPAIFRRGHASATGLALLVLAVGLLVSGDEGWTRGPSLALAGYALVALGMAAPGRLGRRELVLGVGGGVMVAGLLSLTFSVTSPWSARDGYSLRCGMDAVSCARISDQVAAGIALTRTGREITHIEISADGSAAACWNGVTESDNGCWFTTTNDRPPGP
ncbi:MAG: hypothetical protein LH650_08055, partial [Chloroflexi bacterium]|nr:hypothetical protein [Chloroflexota bacterium]